MADSSLQAKKVNATPPTTTRDSKDVTSEERNGAKLLGKRWFDAFRRDDFSDLKSLFISDGDVNVLIAAAGSPGKLSASEAKSRMENAASSVHVALEQSYRRLRDAARRAGVDWTSSEVTSVELYQFRFDKTLRTPYFKGMTLVISADAGRGNLLAIELGGGIQVGEQWVFTEIWEDRLVRWDPPAHSE